MNYKIFLIFCLLNLSGLFIYAQEFNFHRLNVEDGLPHNTVNAFIQDKYGFIWIATIEGLCRFDGYTIRVYYSDNTANTPISNRPSTLFKDSKNDIWIAFSSTTQVCRYNYDTDDFSRYELVDLDSIIIKGLSDTSLKKKSQSNLKNHTWDINKNILIQVDNKTNTEQVHTAIQEKKDFSLDSYLQTLYLDSNGILWIGTDNNGVLYTDTSKNSFKHYIYNEKGYLSNYNDIRAICEDDLGYLWIGTRNNGILRLSPDRLSYEDFYSLFNNRSFSQRDKQIRKIYKDSRGRIWIGTKNGVYKYIISTRKIEHYTTHTTPAFSGDWIYAIEEDKHGILWFGTWNGLVSYHQTGAFMKHNIKIGSIRSIAKDKSGVLWIATEKGLVSLTYDVKLGQVENLKATIYRHNNNTNSIHNDFLYAVDVDDDDNVWIGTNKGLSMFNVHEFKFERFPDYNYLSDAIIRGVMCDKDLVWISHSKGLVRFNRKKKTIRYFDKTDGLQSNEFSEDAYYKNKETSELFFGGSNGINAFFSDSIKDNSILPQVAFTNLRIKNKPIAYNEKVDGDILLKKPIYQTNKLEFGPNIKEFEIEFSALHFSNPSKNRYAYKLEGFDKHWTYTDATRRSVIYSGLPAGKYLLKIKAANADGLWNNDPIEMDICILPPWWQSNTAYIFYCIFFIAIGVIILKSIILRKNLKHRIQLEQVKAQKAKEITRLKSTFFTGISHELKTPITLIIDPLRTLIKDENVPEQMRQNHKLMYRNALRLVNLINQLLDFQRIESSNQPFRPSLNNLVIFIKNILSLFELSAQKKNISLNYNFQLENAFFVFDQNILDKILVNLLSNAIKYSNSNTEITIKILTKDDVEKLKMSLDRDFVFSQIKDKLWFAIQIIDQGIGVAPEMKEKIFDMFFQINNSRYKGISSGIGLALTKELIQLHQGYITIDSELGKGSCFTVFLPHSQTEFIDIESKETIQTSFEVIPNIDSENPLHQKKYNSEHPLILIVEDNEDIRNYIKNTFSECYNIITAKDGNQGLEKTLEFIPDLIVSDIMMPIMSGIELCYKLKNDERTSHIPIILLTADASEECCIESYETGADEYIIKPLNTSVLNIRIQNLIESRRKLRLLFGDATKMELKKISVNSVDERFISRAVKIVDLHICDTNFTPDVFANEMALSRAQLFRKIKAMTNQTVQEFVTSIRLNRATELLLSSEYSIGEVALMTGFSESSNFTRSFSKRFGLTPSNYIKKNR